jgi:hypothetical protein
MKKITKWLSIGSIILLPGLFLLDYKLASVPSYCIQRNHLLKSISFNSSSSHFAQSVYLCLPQNTLTAELNEYVLENYDYPLDSKDSWKLKLEGSFYFSELLGECTEGKKCVVAKFHVTKGGANVFLEGYYHYLILAKDANGKLNKIHESFSPSPNKG